MIPDGAIIEYQSTDWSVNFASGPQDIISQVASAIQQSGLYVRSNSYKTPNILTQIVGDVVGSYKYSVDLQVQIENGVGFASSDDAASIIDHAVFQITGNLPTHSVPNVTDSSGRVLQSSQPNVAPNGGQTWEDKVVGWFQNLTSKGMYALALVGVGVVAAVALILWRGKPTQ